MSPAKLAKFSGQSSDHDQKPRQPEPPFRERDILASLACRERELFLRKCVRKVFSKGESLFREGTPHRATYIIESGLIRTYYESPSGKEITRGYWSAGAMIGGPYFFDDSGINVWSAQAVQHSKVLAITGHDLKLLVMHTPKIADLVLDVLSFKLLWDSLLLQLLGTSSVSSRLAHLLIKLAALDGGVARQGTVVIRHFTQEDVGNMVGASRQWVNLQFRNFQRAGILQIRNREIVVLDIDRLRKLARW